MRMWLAKRKVQNLRNEMYSPGMMHMHNNAGGGTEDYENINVQVSQFLIKRHVTKCSDVCRKCVSN